MPVITFDFHNTIANCDPWFDLEVRHLPSAVVDHLGLPDSARIDRASLDTAYAALRRRVISSGSEIDAFDSVSGILTAHGLPLDRPTIASAVDELMRRALDSLEPITGIDETVSYLRARDCRLGVVSSAVHHRFVEWAIQQLNLDDAFASIVTSASAGYYKSSPRIYHYALRELDAIPGRSVHVGDSLRWDVGGSHQAGMRAIWLDTGLVETQALEPALPIAPDLTIRSMVGAGPTIHEFAIEAEQLADD